MSIQITDLYLGVPFLDGQDLQSVVSESISKEDLGIYPSQTAPREWLDFRIPINMGEPNNPRIKMAVPPIVL